MKKAYLVIFSLIAFNCQSQFNPKVILKTNALYYKFFNGINFNSEFKCKNDRSLNINFSMGETKNNSNSSNKNNLTYFTIENRKYFKSISKDVPFDGLFWGIYNGYSNHNTSSKKPINSYESNNKKIIHYLDSGFLIGYQKIIKQRLALESKVGIGTLYRLNKRDQISPYYNESLSGFLGLGLGIVL